MIHRTLAAVMHEVADGRRAIRLRADARDGDGERIMTATLTMVIDETD